MKARAFFRGLLPLLFGAAAVGCGSSPVTQVVVIVDTSEYVIPSEIDQVVVTVYRANGDALVARADLTAADTSPRTVGVLWEGGRLDGYAVEASGRLSSNATVVTQRALFSFVKGETRYLTFTLNAACAGVSCCGVPVSGSCTEVQTCMPNGLCGPADTTLTTSSPYVSALDEAIGVGAGADAGGL